MPKSAAPTDLFAERAVVSAILHDGKVLDDLSEILHHSDFYEWGQLYAVASKVWEDGNAPTLPLIMDALRDTTGSITFDQLVGLYSDLPDLGNVKVYAKRIIEASHKRKAMHVGQVLLADAGRAETLAGEVIEAAVSDLLTISASQAEDAGEITDVVDAVIRESRENQRTRQKTGLRTGIQNLDVVLRPMRPGWMVTLAADTRVGKTSLALQIAANVALAGGSVAYCCLEMSKEELATRVLAQLSGVNSRRIEDGVMDYDQWERVARFRDRLAETKFWLDGYWHLSVPALRARARARQQRAGLDLLVVDYLQLMIAAKQSENRAAEVSSLSRGVKLLAKELNVPIIVLSQFSRSYSQEKDSGRHGDKLPKMRHLKESSSIEQDSHVVLLMHRECEAGTDNAMRRVTKVIVSKQRSGMSGVVCELDFDEETQCFSNRV